MSLRPSATFFYGHRVLKSVGWYFTAVGLLRVTSTDVAERVSEPGCGDGKSDGQMYCQTTQRTYLSTLHLRSHTVLCF